MDNGISKIFPNALLLILEIISSPTSSSWKNILSTPNITEDGSIKVSTNGIDQGADWMTIPANEDFRLIAISQASAFVSGGYFDPSSLGGTIQLIAAGNIKKIWMMFRWWSPNAGNSRVWNSQGEDSTDATNTIAYGNPNGKVSVLERKAGIWKFYVNNKLIKTYIAVTNEELLLTGEEIWIEDHGIRYDPDAVAAKPRVGVAYAQEDALLPWRFFIKGNKYVSKPNKV